MADLFCLMQKSDVSNVNLAVKLLLQCPKNQTRRQPIGFLPLAASSRSEWANCIVLVLVTSCIIRRRARKKECADLDAEAVSALCGPHSSSYRGPRTRQHSSDLHHAPSSADEPDEVACTCCIHGCAREGRVERALNLLEDLLECGLTPSLVTYNTLMNACAKSHYYAHKAVEFYNEMQELYDYTPDLYSYTTVLHACAKHGDFIQAEQIIRHMERHHVPMTEFVYNTLFNVYARAQFRAIVDKAPRNQKPLPKAEPIYQEPLEWDDDGKEIDLTRPGKETFSLENANYDGRFDEEGEDEDEMDERDS
ncbi:hypothetical protein PInf_008645 [Phytophthora infestans]|nr:hypothetical protein PInf_008645 [Phytophthora infestans]